MATEVQLPDLGENIEEGDIIGVMVAVGDTIAKDQPILEMETGKATIEVPSPVAGTITELHVSEGDKAKVGQVIMSVDAAGGDASPAPPASEPETPAATEEPAAAAPAPAPAPAPEPRVDPKEPPASPPVTPPPPKGAPIAAAPSVRKFARELGVDLRQIRGTGPGGRLTLDDVKAYTKSVVQSGGAAAAAAGPGLAPLPDFTKWGDVEREPMSNIRKATAEHMARCWATIPHVTQNDKADITKQEQLRKAWAKRAERFGTKLTPTAILLKIVASALRAFPQFNSSLDVGNGELVHKKYIHIGVAVDTPKGLVVPVIRDADQKNILELSKELNEFAARAREGKIGLADMQGGTFTITNLGGIGGIGFTPIVNHPEVAILGVSRASMEPVYMDGEFVPRLMMPLSLSYDHRVIDGADAARFTRWIAEAVEEPLLLALEG